MKVRIVYVAIPNYRVPLFEGLLAYDDWNLVVQTCPNLGNLFQTVVAPSEQYDLNHKIVQFGGKRLQWMTGVMNLSGLSKGDVLVVLGNPRVVNFPLLLLKARLKGIATIWWGQGFTAYTANRVGLRQRLMRLADGVILYTDREVERYREMGFRGPKLYAKNNCIDQGPIRAAFDALSPGRVEALRDELGLKGGQVLITVGRLQEKMHLDIALKALADPILSDCKMIVVGDGPMRSAYTDLANSMHTSDRVVWCGKIEDPVELAPYLAVSDVFVYPGAIGLSIFHAFGSGLPVITHGNENNQMPEFAALVPNVNGLTFDEGDVASFVQSAHRLLTSPDLPSMRTAALDTVEEWSMDHTIGRMREAILDVALRKNGQEEAQPTES